MSKKVMRILTVLLMVAMVVTTLSPLVLADGTDTLNTDQFDNPTKTAQDAEDSLTNVIGAAIRIVQIVGVGVAIIMLVVLGIKYISASPSEKADIKKSLMIYVAGAFLLFAASGILEIVKKFITSAVGKE